MSYYYSVLDATSGANVIYLYHIADKSFPQSSNIAKWIIAGFVVIIFGMGIFYYYQISQKKKQNAGGSDSLMVQESLKEPLI